MSFSSCLKCQEMVSYYEKYCDRCAINYQQDPIFWKGRSYDFYKEPLRTQELNRDAKKGRVKLPEDNSAIPANLKLPKNLTK